MKAWGEIREPLMKPIEESKNETEGVAHMAVENYVWFKDG